MAIGTRAVCLGGQDYVCPLGRSTRQFLIQFGAFPNLFVLHGRILLPSTSQLRDPEQINHPLVMIDLLCGISTVPASVRVPLFVAQGVALSGCSLATLVLFTIEKFYKQDFHVGHLGR